MDIKSLSTKKAGDVVHRLQFMSPIDGTPLVHDGHPMFAEVVSKNSKTYKRSLSRIVNADQQANKFGNKKFSVSAEEMKKANLVAACTRRLCFFENGEWVDIRLNSEDETKRHQAIRDAYLEYDWMREQSDIEIANNANFLGKSLESSNSTSDTELG